MQKLKLRKSSFEGIKSDLIEIKRCKEHDKFVKQANIEIQKGNLKYAKAFNNAKNYYTK